MENNNQKGLYKYFKSPVKGVFDIILIMTITVVAVVVLGPIILESLPDSQIEAPQRGSALSYIDPITNNPTRDYLRDDYGEVIGWFDVEYHENGAFRQVTEHNERDNTIVKVFYSDESEFLYWIEIQLCENGNILSEKMFDSNGRLISS